MGRARVLLADDHRAVCESIAALLASEFDVVEAVANGRDLITEAAKLQPDVVVTDISMPVLGGIEAAEQIRVSNPQAKVVFLTIHDRVEFVRACLAIGAMGSVTKSRLTSDLILAIHEVLAGQVFISPTLHFPDEQQRKEQSA